MALFLPVHFLVLGMAVEAAALDALLSWTEAPLVKLAESGLVSFDYTARKVVPLPDAVRQICQEP